MDMLILASHSPRRRDILQRMGFTFKVEPSDFPEEDLQDMTPQELAEYLSLQKAQKIANLHPYATVIGADTVVVLEDEILGKPKNSDEAIDMLRKLSGKTHTVISAFTLINLSKALEKTTSDKTRVKFRKLENEEITDYVSTGKPMDKAGGYGIQEEAGKFVESIEGDFNNVVGLPSRIEIELRTLGI